MGSGLCVLLKDSSVSSVPQFPQLCVSLMPLSVVKSSGRGAATANGVSCASFSPSSLPPAGQRMTRSPLLRRHGVPECILLVTQRITKYPVLIERILKNSKGNAAGGKGQRGVGLPVLVAGGRFPALTVSPQSFIPDNEGDSVDLSRALKLVKELISSINEEVHTCEMNARLWDVYRRVDGRAKVQLPWESRAGVFGKDELLRRKLVHSGCMLWKTAAGRFKGGDQGAEGGPGCWGWRWQGMGILGDQGAKDWGTRDWGCPGTRLLWDGDTGAWG